QSGPARRITIRNNAFSDVGGQWTFGRLFQLLNGASDITIDHNTALQTESIMLVDSPLPLLRFVFTNNIVAHNQYGIIGAGNGVGTATINTLFPCWSARRDVFL